MRPRHVLEAALSVTRSHRVLTHCASVSHTSSSALRAQRCVVGLQKVEAHPSSVVHPCPTAAGRCAQTCVVGLQ